jgi:hypothetical protein
MARAWLMFEKRLTIFDFSFLLLPRLEEHGIEFNNFNYPKLSWCWTLVSLKDHLFRWCKLLIANFKIT